MDLNDGSRLRHGVVMHLRREERIAADRQIMELRLVELVAHAERERAGDDRHVLVGRMEVRIDLVAGRHLEAHDVETFLARITRQHRHAGALLEHWRGRAPLEVLSRGEDVTILGERGTDHGGNKHERQQQCSFHRSSSCRGMANGAWPSRAASIDSRHMNIDPAVVTQAELHRFMIGVVIPRPIAWVSTIGADGGHNLAPFSFFNAIASKPPLLIVSINERPDGPKDTLRHIRETKDFVINLVDEPLMQRMVETSGEWAPEVDEFALTQLTPAPSERVKSPRVAEAPVSMECVLERILDFESTSLVIGRMVWGCCREDLLTDGRVDALKLRPVARLGGDGYTVVREVIRMQRPRAPKPDAARDG